MYRKAKNEKDVKYILDNLRSEDVEEAKAIYGENYKEQIFNNIMNTEFYVLLGLTKNKDIPVVMGGIFEANPENKSIGIAWLMCTKEVKKHIKCLFKELKTEIEKADDKFWMTFNFIHKNNKMMKKWLKTVGYKFDNPHPDGVNVPTGFEFFYRIREVKGIG